MWEYTQSFSWINYTHTEYFHKEKEEDSSAGTGQLIASFEFLCYSGDRRKEIQLQSLV